MGGLGKVLGHEPGEAEVHGKFANGMNGGRDGGGGNDVGGGKHAGCGSVDAGVRRALNGENAREVDRFIKVEYGMCLKLVFNAAKCAVGGGGEVAWEEVGKGKGIFALLEANRLVEKYPFLKDCRYTRTVGAIFGHGFLRKDFPHQDHLKGGYLGLSFQHDEFELAGEDGTRRSCERAVKD